MDEIASKRSVIDYACRLHSSGLTVANSGNLSVRYEAGFLITPSGIPYEQLKPNDISYVLLDGQRLSGRRPSSEWRIHADIYLQHEDIGSVVHAHSKAATALSCLRRPLPAFHYMVARFGGYEVPCAEYATFGTAALSEAVCEPLKSYKACLMANHGMLTAGRSLEEAFTLALELEDLCSQYLLAKQHGEPVLLSDLQMKEAMNAFKNYGQNDC